MSRTFYQLTAEQRYTIQQLKKQNFSMTAIADIIGKDKSCVSRELKRNAMYNDKYKAHNAQQFCDFFFSAESHAVDSV